MSNQKPTFGKLFILSLELSKASKAATSVERYCWSSAPAGICTFTRKGKSSETRVAREAIFFFFFFNDHGQSQGKLTSQFCGTGLVHVLSNGPYVPSVLG